MYSTPALPYMSDPSCQREYQIENTSIQYLCLVKRPKACINKSAEAASHNVAIATAGTVLYEDGDSFFTGPSSAIIYFYTIGIKPVSESLDFYNQRKMTIFNKSITNNTVQRPLRVCTHVGTLHIAVTIYYCLLQ